jgi:hypothetical protein
VQQASRHDLARVLAPRYVRASRGEKSQLLDEFCALTGYTRKHALVLLSDPPGEGRPRRVGGRPRRYGPAEVALLRMCWSATDGICSKRLAPFLPGLLERLRHWHALRHVSAETIARVAHMNPSTIDRALAASRAGPPKRGISTTRPGALLKHQVAIKTFRRLDRDGARLCGGQSGRALWLARKMERQLTIRWAAVNPLRLKLELESAQRTLAERAVHLVITHPPPVGSVMRRSFDLCTCCARGGLAASDGCADGCRARSAEAEGR